MKTKFITESRYTGVQKLDNLFLIVVSDKNTRSCLNYYKEFLLDSLKVYGIKVDGTFFCCRDKNTNVKDLISSNLPAEANYENILTVVISKTIVGHGTSSSRELTLNLFDVVKAETTWSGMLKADFEWFVSDDNYRQVANKLAFATLSKLKSKAVF